MADLLASFETGYEQPTLGSVRLFSRYADDLAVRLQHQYPEHAGYQIKVEKREDNPRRIKWHVEVLKGWFTGARVEIKPIARTPHRVRVKVLWHSRLLGAMMKGFAILTLPALIIVFIGVAMLTRVRLSLLLTAGIAIAWALLGAIVMLVIARLCAAIFGNEFDSGTRMALAHKIQQFPLPQSKPARE
jgi:hypothetical protein